MKQKLLLTIGAIFASLLVITGVTYAASGATWSPHGVTGEGAVTLEKGTTHEGSFYAAGERVNIDGDVNGDLYCAGMIVTIAGNVSGDVVCGAQDITISGKVGDSARLAGQTIELDSEVAGDVSAFGQVVEVADGARIGGDLNGSSQRLVLDGTVAKNLRYGAQLLALGGSVKGTSDLSLQFVDQKNEGKFEGDVFYAGPESLDIKQYASGEVTRNATDGYADKSDYAAAAVKTLAVIAGSMLIFALFVVLVAPRFLDRSRQFAKRDMLNTVLVGLAAVFATPFVLVILMASVIGIPIALFLTFAWLAVLLLSGSFFAYMVGSWILSSSSNVVLRMLVGSITVLILYIIPLVNVFVILAAGVVGSGMVLRGLTHGYQRPEYSLTGEKKVAKKKTAKK